MRRPVALAAVSVGIVTAVALSGCAKSANADAAGTASSSVTLVSATGGNTLDPAQAQDITSDELTLAAYDTLVEYKVKDGKQVSGQYTPSLATQWSTRRTVSHGPSTSEAV